MAAQWPLVVQRLAALLPTLPGWSSVAVFDGPPIAANDDSIYFTVGYVDGVPAGTASTSEAGGGFFNDEVGQVVSQLVVNTGSTDVSAARAQVFALYDALDASVKADRTLGGVLQGGATSALSYEVQYVSNRQGVAVALIVTVSYQTTT
jgi:hypothetical protein